MRALFLLERQVDALEADCGSSSSERAYATTTDSLDGGAGTAVPSSAAVEEEEEEEEGGMGGMGSMGGIDDPSNRGYGAELGPPLEVVKQLLLNAPAGRQAWRGALRREGDVLTIVCVRHSLLATRYSLLATRY